MLLKLIETGQTRKVSQSDDFYMSKRVEIDKAHLKFYKFMTCRIKEWKKWSRFTDFNESEKNDWTMKFPRKDSVI